MSKAAELKQVKQYIADFKAAGGVLERVSIVSHWRYGTDPITLANKSKHGIVYPPPGH